MKNIKFLDGNKFSYKLNGVNVTEPNIYTFKHKGLQCLVFRNPELGHLCGYVGVKGVNNIDENSLSVHGGITFTHGYNELGMIQPYFSSDEYVYGFDTAHSCDCIPLLYMRGSTYRDFKYVKAEVVKLADELSELIV
jgi:hypothetical protein